MADSDRDWCRWAETEPYFGVLVDPRFRMTSIAGNRDAFFELGRLSVEERVAAAERHFGAFGRGRALDFGCGVGRLTLPLAALFEEVVGLDIAPAMLAEARHNAQAHGVTNCRFARSDDGLSEAGGSFDLVITSMVLQHIPVRRGLQIVQQLLSRVAPGGIAALQFCIERNDSAASRWRYWAQCHIPGAQAVLNLMRGRSWREPLMQMNAYPLGMVLALAHAAGFGAALVETVPHGRFMTAQLLLRRQ